MHLGLEPEPDCYIETCGEMISFFNDTMLLTGVG